MRKLLLLNPPYARPVQRDYLCPHGVKADYYWPPIDLLLFGASARRQASLHWLDAIASRLGRAEALERAVSVGPDDVFAVISSVTLEEDLSFLAALRIRLPRVRIWASGDVVSFAKVRREPIDVLVHDFTNRAEIEALLRSGGSGEIPASNAPVWSVGVCPHELTLQGRYVLPYSLHGRVTAVATNFGCPFRCSFCNSGAIPFKRRAVGEVIEELAEIERLGIREVLMRDFTFNASDARSICDGIQGAGIRLAWSCWTSASLVDRSILEAMKAAGCYLVSFGVESGVDRALAEAGRPADTAAVRRAVALARWAGLEVQTSFVLGLPGDEPEHSRAFLFDLAPDYVSVNVLAPRLGSELQRRAGGMPSGRDTDSLLSGGEALQRARDELERSFFLRPSQLVRYLRLSLKSPRRIASFSRSAVALMRRWWGAART